MDAYAIRGPIEGPIIEIAQTSKHGVPLSTNIVRRLERGTAIVTARFDVDITKYTVGNVSRKLEMVDNPNGLHRVVVVGKQDEVAIGNKYVQVTATENQSTLRYMGTFEIKEYEPVPKIVGMERKARVINAVNSLLRIQ